MSPVDEFFAFKALMENGTNSPATLAKRFGFSERVVKQRLRLAELAPEILDALGERKITLDAAMAYATSQDLRLQRDVFKAHNRPNAWDAHNPQRIKRDLRGAGMDTGHKLFRFIGADAYEQQGGGYEDDLFDDAGKERVLTHAHLVEAFAHDHVDELMAIELPRLRKRADLAPTIVGYVKVPDLDLQSWGTSAKLKEPDGFVKVDKYDGDKMWKTIRNNRIDVHVLVGVSAEGELKVWPRIAFVPKAQKNVVDPAPQHQHSQQSPEQRAADERKREVDRWARRLAIGTFAGTPLEGRAFWPDRWDDSHRVSKVDGIDGWLVPVRIFVTDAAIAAQAAAAELRYDEELAKEAERRAAEKAAQAASDQHEAELRALDPPAVIVIDGAAWFRAEDGTYASDVDEDDFATDWLHLIETTDIDDIGDVFATREDFDAAMAAAEPVAEEVPA